MKPSEASALLSSYFDTWYSSLVRYAYVMTGSLQPSEDLVQDVFLRLYGELRSGKSIENPRAWMFCVLRHEIGREHSRRASEVVDEALAIEHSDLLSQADAPFDIDKQLELDEVSNLMVLLTPREQEVLLLRMASLKYREIAERLDISSSAVNALLARAIKKLRKATQKRGWSQSTDALERIPKTLQ